MWKQYTEKGVNRGVKQSIDIYRTLQETQSIRKTVEKLGGPEKYVREIANEYQIK